MSKCFTADQKAILVKRHLLEQVPISKLCDECGIRPATFHQWLQEFFANGAAAFAASSRGRGRPRKEYSEYQQICDLERKLAQRDEGMAQLLAEHIELKKKLGLL